MSTGFIFQDPKQRIVGPYGTTLPGASRVFYFSGTTTLAPVYADVGLNVQLTNPIQADATGQFPVIYLDPVTSYRVQLYDQFGSLQYDVDPGAIGAGSGSTSTSGGFGTETTLPSSSTVDLGSAPGHTVYVTGTTTINSFGNTATIANPIYICRFQAGLTITNSTSLIVPGGSNIQTTSSGGDSIIVEYLGSGVWQILNYQAAGSPAPTGSVSLIKHGDTGYSTTTITNDPELFIPALNAGWYSFDILLNVSAISPYVQGTNGFLAYLTGTAAASHLMAKIWIYSDTQSAFQDNSTGRNGAFPQQISCGVVPVNGLSSFANQISISGSLQITSSGSFGIAGAQTGTAAGSVFIGYGSYLKIFPET